MASNGNQARIRRRMHRRITRSEAVYEAMKKFRRGKLDESRVFCAIITAATRGAL